MELAPQTKKIQVMFLGLFRLAFLEFFEEGSGRDVRCTEILLRAHAKTFSPLALLYKRSWCAYSMFI